MTRRERFNYWADMTDGGYWLHCALFIALTLLGGQIASYWFPVDSPPIAQTCPSEMK